ncbi:hypothetical protein [Bacillus paramycoides]|uniref:hypothetical protein n=1 Tax=Bacillus paramycoides TaxID=2026194 RepID=UPI002E1D5A9B|nr:hypothetical protein [Bacillus paramycoides]
MEEVTYQILLPKKFWEVAKDKDELKRLIRNHFSIGYPNYSVKRIVQNGDFHIAICVRRD